MQLESILIPNHLTWQQFGCKSQAYFDQYIKGRRLPVIFDYGKIKVLKTADGQQWHIHEDDLIQDKAKWEMKAMESIRFEWEKDGRAIKAKKEAA